MPSYGPLWHGEPTQTLMPYPELLAGFPCADLGKMLLMLGFLNFPSYVYVDILICVCVGLCVRAYVFV